ncbi:MAG TPA: bifunctional UDP-N-acetylglucosamine diphosphorylase/glucosamine-1-phosphate N-acetyltransferase GlmU [Trebonia sp.]|nr:bifunctional UDP-N-acetylglucosamine diphosphorylase/glucosamine-1-phosphate N-acetyltransferase GlmU [Trebonia sp.]
MSESRPAAVIILAAGEGKRMKSRTPKVLHALCGRSMLGHALAAARDLDPERLVAVVGHARDQVAPEVARLEPQAAIVVQEQQLGTGHAVRMVTEAAGVIDGVVVVTYGDMPLLRSQTLQELVDAHRANGNAATVLTAKAADPHGYGRVVRDDSGAFLRIVEDADATPEQRSIQEINSGCYAFEGALLADAIKRVATNNAQSQEYLTDVLDILRGEGHPIGSVVAADAGEIQGVNDRVQLATARRELNDRLLRGHMLNGVTVVDPATTWVDVTVTIGQDAEIRPNTQLIGDTSIGEGALVGPNCLLEDTRVGAEAELLNVVSRRASIGAKATLGPNVYLRPETVIGDGAHVGCHVEVKKSTVGPGAKVPHLTYVGDATIGAGANIGAGTIFANYDGQRKWPTAVGENAFVGSNTVLIAPVTVHDGAYTAAGSAICEDVEAGDLGIARGRQHNSDGWVLRNRDGAPSAATARRARSGALAKGDIPEPPA